MTVYSFSIDDQPFSVEIGLIQGNVANVTVNQVPYRVRIDGSSLVSSPASAPAPRPAPRAEAPKPAAPKPAAPKPSPAPPKPAAPVSGGGERITAPIPGKVMSVMAKVGDSVSAGQVLLVIEAMKMENNIISPIDGTVKEIAVSNNADVSTGDLLAVVG
ncbi:MAG: biotin/lipoyl-binding protein [Desulfobacteraceae bacterium]|nr:biotin/lipoyl-binding protein [Desulfobacteraceae bacterium]